MKPIKDLSVRENEELLNGYGISADAATDVIIAKLKTHPEKPA